jgi:hypothetical protein
MLALGIGTVPAWSANITITDITDTISITAGNFEGGFSAGGITFTQGLFSNDTHDYNEADGAISFSGTWVTGGAAGSGSTTLYLVEALDPTVVSDILSYSWGNSSSAGRTTITGSFTSDFENNLGHLADYQIGTNDRVVTEDGTPVGFSLAFLGGTVQSDVDATPEPASVLYLGTGFGLLLVGLKKYRRS